MSVSKDFIEASVAKSNQDLFEHLSTAFNTSVDPLKRASTEVSELQTREIKKLKTAEHKVFKRKGNEIQYKFNVKVKDIINDTKSFLLSNALDKAKESLEEGITLIQDRQKLILLADKSEFGKPRLNTSNMNSQ